MAPIECSNGHPHVLLPHALALWLAPRAAAELRERAGTAAQRVSARTSARMRQTEASVTGAAEELTRHVRDVRDDLADAVADGARQVERYAVGAKTGATT